MLEYIMQCIVAQINVKPDCCEEYEIEFAKGAKTVQQNEQGMPLVSVGERPKVKENTMSWKSIRITQRFKRT